jgi:K+-transporting ATPase KdpF subunit
MFAAATGLPNLKESAPMLENILLLSLCLALLVYLVYAMLRPEKF